MRRRRSRVLGVVGLAVVVALWHLVAAGLGGAEAMVPFPFDVARAILERWHADDFGGNLLVSLSRVAVGFVVGASVGTVVGIVSGWSLIAGRMLFVPLELARYVPALAWVPLAAGLKETAAWYRKNGYLERASLWLFGLASSYWLAESISIV